MRARLIVISTVLLLGGCSGSPSPTADAAPEVATLQSPAAAATASAPSQVAPVIRPDSTFEEVARMQQPWMTCLKANGVPMRTAENGLLDIDAAGKVNGRIMATRDKKVVAACGKLMPVLAPELDEDRNPYWADDNDNYHECLVEGGYDMVKKDGEWAPGPGWFDAPPNEALELGCQAKAFDGKRG